MELIEAIKEATKDAVTVPPVSAPRPDPVAPISSLQRIIDIRGALSGYAKESFAWRRSGTPAEIIVMDEATGRVNREPSPGRIFLDTGHGLQEFIPGLMVPAITRPLYERKPDGHLGAVEMGG